jgi:hypothetical protein
MPRVRIEIVKAVSRGAQTTLPSSPRRADGELPDPRRPSHVSVVVLEPTLESWCVRGGHSADEVDLGFPLDV